MALIFDLALKRITVQQADLTLISGTLFDFDTEAFKLEVGLAQATEEGIAFDDVILHNTEVTIAGVTLARTIEIINGWSIVFEDGQYTVRLVGSNNNIFDVANGILIQNQVQIISQNSAGLINAASAAAVFDTVIEGTETFRELLRLLRAPILGLVTRVDLGGGAFRWLYKSLNGLKTRVNSTTNADNERDSVTTDSSE